MYTIGITELATVEVYIGRCMLPGKDVKEFMSDITAKVMVCSRMTTMRPNLKGANMLGMYRRSSYPI